MTALLKPEVHDRSRFDLHTRVGILGANGGLADGVEVAEEAARLAVVVLRQEVGVQNLGFGIRLGLAQDVGDCDRLGLLPGSPIARRDLKVGKEQDGYSDEQGDDNTPSECSDELQRAGSLSALGADPRRGGGVGPAGGVGSARALRSNLGPAPGNHRQGRA